MPMWDISVTAEQSSAAKIFQGSGNSQDPLWAADPRSLEGKHLLLIIQDKSHFIIRCGAWIVLLASEAGALTLNLCSLNAIRRCSSRKKERAGVSHFLNGLHCPLLSIILLYTLYKKSLSMCHVKEKPFYCMLFRVVGFYTIMLLQQLN